MILAVDPGRDKSGIAVVAENFNVYHKEVIPTSELELYLRDLIHNYNIQELVLGDGTFSDKIENRIKGLFPLPLHLVDESHTTLEAEERYRQENYRGIKRLLGFISWKPSRPVDDYVAVILAEKYLKKK